MWHSTYVNWPFRTSSANFFFALDRTLRDANPACETRLSWRASQLTFTSKDVCIHGDSHYYRIDKPLKDESGGIYLHFTRMEVFGSPNVAGVVVSVDPNDPLVFSYRPYYLKD